MSASACSSSAWPTPETTREKGGPNQSFGAGGVPLPAQTAQWMTPRSHEVGQYQYSRGDKTKPVATLTSQAFSLPDRPISTVGEERSHIRRTLNPLFVEWLMGWPPGWTCLGLTPPASTASACSAMALCRWKALMRSALSQLASPPPAAPAQLGLVRMMGAT
jgi:hypothetical protein